MVRTGLLNKFRKENSFQFNSEIFVLNLLRRQKGNFIITLGRMLTFFLNISLSILILLLTIVLFKEHLKWADVKPVYKKTSDKENIKKISGQLAFSKIYERFLYKQLYDYFDVIFS